MIQVTEKAAKRAVKMAEKKGIPKILRVGVRGGGCSGLSYVMDFIDTIKADDVQIECAGLTLVCDPKSLEFLKETILDYDSNLLNGGFRFNNPKAKRSCSCGESFSV